MPPVHFAKTVLKNSYMVSRVEGDLWIAKSRSLLFNPFINILSYFSSTSIYCRDNIPTRTWKSMMASSFLKMVSNILITCSTSTLSMIFCRFKIMSLVFLLLPGSFIQWLLHRLLGCTRGRGLAFNYTICWSYVLHFFDESRRVLSCACVIITTLFRQTSFTWTDVLEYRHAGMVEHLETSSHW